MIFIISVYAYSYFLIFPFYVIEKHILTNDHSSLSFELLSNSDVDKLKVRKLAFLFLFLSSLNTGEKCKKNQIDRKNFLKQENKGVTIKYYLPTCIMINFYKKMSVFLDRHYNFIVDSIWRPYYTDLQCKSKIHVFLLLGDLKIRKFVKKKLLHPNVLLSLWKWSRVTKKFNHILWFFLHNHYIPNKLRK